MKNIIIIGAGPAGLTAAIELQRSDDCNVTVLEADSHYVGGISRTVEHNGNHMDMGGHRFFSKSDRVNKFWTNTLEMMTRRRVSRIYYHGKFFDYPISAKPQTFINLGLWVTIKAGFSFLASQVHKLPETSLENFYINRFGRVLYSLFFESYTEKLWGRHPCEISADWGAQRVKGLSVTAVLKDMFGKLIPKKNRKIETSLIEQFLYPPLGPGQMWETVAERFSKLGGTLLFNKKVTDFEQTGNEITAVLCGKERFEADVFISSMPLKDLTLGLHKAPSDILHIAKGLPYRDFVTIGLLVPKLKLKNKTNLDTFNDIIPDCWVYVQDKGVKLGRIQVFNNWSPHMVKDVRNTVWIGLEYFCCEGDEFWNMSEQETVAYAVRELNKIGVLSADTPVLDSHREFVEKAYPAYFDTYSEIDKLVQYLDTITNLWCVGRNGQHRYNNMDHSMLTAMFASDSILSGNSDRHVIWNVNTEDEYHEAK